MVRGGFLQTTGFRSQSARMISWSDIPGMERMSENRSGLFVHRRSRILSFLVKSFWIWTRPEDLDKSQVGIEEETSLSDGSFLLAWSASEINKEWTIVNKSHTNNKIMWTISITHSYEHCCRWEGKPKKGPPWGEKRSKKPSNGEKIAKSPPI